MHKIQLAMPQAFIDTPHIIYSQWNRAIDQRLGTLHRNLNICLIGGGIANVVVAFELVKAGARVTLLEAREEVGGRARSVVCKDGINVAEMGAMRYSPSSGLLYHYAKQLGYCFTPDFPDPGRVPTVLSYRGTNFYWNDINSIPQGFEKVQMGWKAFVQSGIKREGEEVLASLIHLRVLLQSEDVKVRLKAVPLWQKYIEIFRHDTFIRALLKIFGSQHQWEVPGGEVWDEEDFERFGSLGIGCGGYGPVFDRDFTYLCRLVVNGLEDKQASFARLEAGRTFPAPIQDLVESICSKAAALGATIRLQTLGEVVSSAIAPAGGSSITVQETHRGVSTKNVYDLVIIGTTTRAVIMTMGYTGSYFKRLLPLPVLSATNRISMLSATKIVARVKKFWDDQERYYPRVILSDTKVPQLYTLDYGHPEYGMVVLAYNWGELSDQIMAVRDDSELYEIMRAQIDDVMRHSEFPEYAEHLKPIDEDDIHIVHWQLVPTALGAFTLPKPGQANMIADCFYDFKKLLREEEGSGHSGVLLNGDSITFEGGWIEGALRSAMNVTSAVLCKYGSLERENKAPINLLHREIYDY